MRQYEQILNKVSYVFYKFINYSEYFEDNYRLAPSYFKGIDFPARGLYPFSEIPIIKIPTYLLSILEHATEFVPSLRHTTVSVPSIHLFKSYRKDKSFLVSYDEAIVNLVINNFSFENHNILYSSTNTHLFTFKDLFIALVGKDTYETIKNNIK